MSEGPTPTFLGESEGERKDARFVVFPIPYESTTTYLKGCAQGPPAILAASANIEIYDEEAECEPHLAGIHTAPPFADSPPPKDLPARLKAQVEPWARAGKFTVTLGGEHAVSLGPILAYKTVFPDLSVLQIDAHADLRDSYEGTPYSHACVARRIQEHCPLVQVGVRSLSAEEARDLPTLNVRSFFWKEMRSLHGESVERILPALSEHVYLSIDIDGFDPAFAPATGTPEPGGYGWRDVSNLVEAVAANRTLVALDVTEVRPVPGDVRTEILAARLILRVMAWVHRAGRT
ncbi:MAG: agmatinase [Planctomycetota bacterium]|jgi:agmatinase